jgi:hypothetical protein
MLPCTLDNRLQSPMIQPEVAYSLCPLRNGPYLGTVREVDATLPRIILPRLITNSLLILLHFSSDLM